MTKLKLVFNGQNLSSGISLYCFNVHKSVSILRLYPTGEIFHRAKLFISS